ncbi:ribosome biogenesis GTPase Der [Fervidobacterium sp. 2310opik-2]|uniref:ribosome biogenesis GTPase Der n=1 Tax=Fervidobacterium sp. 2310opik-2 TaxID=1755815 RepID=UPI0013E0B48D|nr:ribosome biogenesis GTPase Der [Fervidobacterium sp. 2310opik-2]KAF2962440.1 ribosome-associated GTPase EngA [Fervidobacterium sp. 2310opik-2]
MPTVILVGKSNVGKSTLFNKLVGKRKSIVADENGTTRDAVVDRVVWYDKTFQLVDTCGIFEGKNDEIYEKSKEITIKSLSEADLVIFVVDGRKGLSSEDYTIADLIRKSGAEVILAANKVENEKIYQKNLPDFFSLGLGEPFPVSAEQSRNLDELIETIINKLTSKGLELTASEYDENIIRVTLVGKPNAGKSSLFNMIVKEERALVTPIAGTTRDIIDEIVQINNKNYLFVDTAGLRKKSRIEDFIERVSTMRTIDSIERSDVVVLVIDATEGITRQDQRIAGLAEKNGKATVIVFNKWDLVKHADKRVKEYIDQVNEKLYFIDYSPVVFTSTVSKVGYKELINAINKSYESLHKRVPTSAINSAIQRMIIKPPHGLKLYYGLQVDIRPPTFLFFVNKTEVPESFQNAIRRTIRENIEPFVGAPIFLKFKERE